MITNKLDLTIDNVYEVYDTVFKLSDTSGHNRKIIQVIPSKDDWFHLDEGIYEISSNVRFSLDAFNYGMIMPSNLITRNGCFIVSKMYEPHYQGLASFQLHVRGGPADIKKGTKIAEMFYILNNFLSKIYPS